MSHTPSTRLHAHANRACDLTVTITTDLTPGAIQHPHFRIVDRGNDIVTDISDITLEADTTPGRVLAHIHIASGDIDLSPGTYRWWVDQHVDGDWHQPSAHGLIDISPSPTQPTIP